MEPGPPTTAELHELLHTEVADNIMLRRIISLHEQRFAEMLYACTELLHHFNEHGLKRGSLTVRTQEVLVAIDLGAYNTLGQHRGIQP